MSSSQTAKVMKLESLSDPEKVKKFLVDVTNAARKTEVKETKKTDKTVPHIALVAYAAPLARRGSTLSGSAVACPRKTQKWEFLLFRYHYHSSKRTRQKW